MVLHTKDSRRRRAESWGGRGRAGRVVLKVNVVFKDESSHISSAVKTLEPEENMLAKTWRPRSNCTIAQENSERCTILSNYDKTINVTISVTVSTEEQFLH